MHGAASTTPSTTCVVRLVLAKSCTAPRAQLRPPRTWSVLFSRSHARRREHNSVHHLRGPSCSREVMHGAASTTPSTADVVRLVLASGSARLGTASTTPSTAGVVHLVLASGSARPGTASTTPTTAGVVPLVLAKSRTGPRAQLRPPRAWSILFSRSRARQRRPPHDADAVGRRHLAERVEPPCGARRPTLRSASTHLAERVDPPCGTCRPTLRNASTHLAERVDPPCGTCRPTLRNVSTQLAERVDPPAGWADRAWGLRRQTLATGSSREPPRTRPSVS
jgi:hypothetical protein